MGHIAFALGLVDNDLMFYLWPYCNYENSAWLGLAWLGWQDSPVLLR